MAPQPTADIPARYYFSPNHLKLHNYWLNSMRSKGAKISDDEPAYKSPFFEIFIKFYGSDGGYIVNDNALGEYFDELKEAIDKADPSPNGQKEFKEFMEKFFLSLPADVIHKRQPTTGKFERVNW